jgi:probable DNA metabolism protein
VEREKHRMEAFVRFQLTRDNLFYAIVQPDFNVLPLIQSHFKSRYADQRWMIYDIQRKYGIYYDLAEVTEVQIMFSDLKTTDPASIYDEKETMYQELWKQYFSSVNIKARKNTKLHIQHMPKRYWKHLTEKKI